MTRLIVGLGNPGAKYHGSRHNVGFACVEHYAAAHSLSFQPKVKFKAHVAELSRGDDKILIAKPTTYYNLSGEAVRAITDFYKIASENVLIVHDELMLPFGTLRTRCGGSDAGNNGIKSINDHIGQGTHRLRIGVYNGLRDQIDDADFVLSKFTRAEAEQLETLQQTIAGIIDDFIDGRLSHTTHRAPGKVDD